MVVVGGCSGTDSGTYASTPSSPVFLLSLNFVERMKKYLANNWLLEMRRNVCPSNWLLEVGRKVCPTTATTTTCSSSSSSSSRLFNCIVEIFVLATIEHIAYNVDAFILLSRFSFTD